MRPLLIVNPRSGGGRTGRLFDKMRIPIRKAIGEFTVAHTTGPRHAVDLAREAALAGCETVIVVGGDGSIHETVNGLMQARDQGASGTRLGIIGQGTGGDFRKTLGIKHRLDHYCATIAGGTTRAIDIGRFTYRANDGTTATSFFVNILSVGMSGVADRFVSETSRAFGGTLAYVSASFRALAASRVGHVRCTATLRGQTRVADHPTRLLAICNGRFFGSGMKIAPMAELDDGLFEVVDLGGAPLLPFATLSTGMYTGRHIRHPDVRHFQCDRIELDLLNRDVDDSFLLDVDGEPFGRLPITVTLEHRAIEALVPAAPHL